jgi:hypothetical protein
VARVGTSYVNSVWVREPPDEVMERMVTATAGVAGYTLSTVSVAEPRSLVLTRRFIPAYAIEFAVFGAVCFLVPLLALLIKEDPGYHHWRRGPRTRVSVSGVVDQQMSSHINSVVVALTPFESQNQSPRDSYAEAVSGRVSQGPRTSS